MKQLFHRIVPVIPVAFALAACSGSTGVGQTVANAIDGRAIYERDCLACHMSSGRGVPGMTPTLIASPWINGSEDALIGYMLTGGFGAEILMGRFDFLSDAEMAAVLNFVRREYEGGDAPITTERVASVRAQVVLDGR